jgi:hypothetical protein
MNAFKRWLRGEDVVEKMITKWSAKLDELVEDEVAPYRNALAMMVQAVERGHVPPQLVELAKEQLNP